jgi:hypothetical protein
MYRDRWTVAAWCSYSDDILFCISSSLLSSIPHEYNFHHCMDHAYLYCLPLFRISPGFMRASKSGSLVMAGNAGNQHMHLSSGLAFLAKDESRMRFPG